MLAPLFFRRMHMSSETFQPVDQQAIVNAYVSDTSLTVPQVAEKFGLKPRHVSAILAINNIKVRRGANNLTDDARAAGIAKRKHMALLNKIIRLIEEHGEETIREYVAEAVMAVNLNKEFDKID